MDIGRGQCLVLVNTSLLRVFLLQDFLFLLLDLSIDFGTLAWLITMRLGLGQRGESALAYKE
jgi:hypothetical protein